MLEQVAPKRTGRFWVVSLAFVAAGILPHASAQTESADSEVSQARIEALIRQLSVANFEQRESADESLRAIGMPAVDALSKAYRAVDDYETSLRIERIAERIYFWERILKKHGFLGIEHRPYARGQSRFFREDDQRIPQGIAAFAIERVIEGTSAERYGLSPGDIIVAVDGKSIPANSDGLAFAELIRTRAPGSPLEFTFWRGERKLKRVINIGHRPPELYTLDVRHEYESLVIAFPEWWAEHFGPWESRLSSDDGDKPSPYPQIPSPGRGDQ